MIEMKAWSADVMPDCSRRSTLADVSWRWLREYPAHLIRTWRLGSGKSFCLRPVRHDDDALEEAFVGGLSRESRYHRMLSGGGSEDAQGPADLPG